MSLLKNLNVMRSESNFSDDESAPVHRIRKRVQKFSDSDDENDVETGQESVHMDSRTMKTQDELLSHSESESETSYVPSKSGATKSRIKITGSSSDSDTSKNETMKNEEQQMRMINKRNKMKDKFKGLLSSREKQALPQTNSEKLSSESSHNEMSDPESEISSIARIKQKIKKSMASMSSICDPDTSDEEGQMSIIKFLPKQKQRKKQKSAQLIEAKPVRMSAKQAMENMQLIKSESNRMLREKAVSLPYHRPKALSLKDIMSRRKPAVTLDGKALPIKMNEEQLKQYALLLEQRQKEMMELCKSESDEETQEENQCDIRQEKDNNTDIPTTENEMLTDTVSSKVIETFDTSLDVANNILADTEFIQNDLIETVSTEVEAKNSDDVNDDINIERPNIELNDQHKDTDKNDSNPDFKLIYNDSVDETNLLASTEDVIKEDTIQNEINKSSEDFEINLEQAPTKFNSEQESQVISLHYTETNSVELEKSEAPLGVSNENSDEMNIATEDKQDDFFSDDDVNMDDIDRIIENAEIMNDNENINSPMLVKEPLPLNAKPKLMGAPGMVIDLDGGTVSKKLTGVELLKERFTYFARLKTPEELEREKEKKLKPGAQHLKLKQELEEQIAEQRSLEWAKRLEEEKQQHKEMDNILDEAEDSFEKIEAKLDEKEEEESSSENEDEDLVEDDIEIKDKPRKHNAMLDDEAEESDCDENPAETEPGDNVGDIDEDDENNEPDDDDEESGDDTSSDSEAEETVKPKKGRILKAFEDSDDEDVSKSNAVGPVVIQNGDKSDVDTIEIANEVQSASQDDVIQLAQKHQSASDDLFTSQESSTITVKNKDGNTASDEVLGTQTFSILDSMGYNMDMEIKSPSKLDALCVSQPYCDPSINAIVDGSQLPITQTSQLQPTIGEDILALCTGKFYDNEFVSQTEENQYIEDMSSDLISNNLNDTQTAKSEPTKKTVKELNDKVPENCENIVESKEQDENTKKPSADGNLLKSILDELDDPEFDKPKPNKFFTGSNTQKKENEEVIENTQIKKKFIIESDDEAETNVEAEHGKKKKLKKKKPEKRALHISDDETEEEDLDQEDEYASEEEPERLVEYDSEENEIEIKADKPKKKRKVADFFEQEAELTSEDEWVGSGDEDEKGLDRMEREEGDDEVFHQGKLRRELGQIHMRDVLDQDKREVRLIQELLFEDGDLGGGHRQRKFRWRNAGGDDDETGMVLDEFADTQEEEFESEEQWRKQRHEREVFLRQMQEETVENGNLNVSVNRTTIIKANLSSKSMSTLLQEINQSKTENTESPVVQEKKTAKDIPSPKKAFSIFQQNYHGSLLTRGRGALARLAALATPLAADDDAPKIGSLTSHKRNFVFTALTPDDDDVQKVTVKRKADVNLGTPKLMKKMKIEEKQARPKSSLLDHLNL